MSSGFYTGHSFKRELIFERFESQITLELISVTFSLQVFF